LVGGVLKMKKTIVKILNFVDKQKKNVLIGATALGMSAGVVNASSGVLDIKNNLDLKGSSNDLRLNWSSSSSVSEGLDSSIYDTPLPSIMPDYSGIYSVVQGTKLMKDSRPNYVNEINFDLAFNGGLVDSTQNWQTFSFPYSSTFANDSITFQQFDPNDPNVAYPVYDVRKAIYYNDGNIQIANTPAGTYSPDEPYAHGAVYFDRNLADFNNDGIVDLLDFFLLSQEWGKTGNSLADIAIAVGNTGIVLPGTTSPYFDGVVDIGVRSVNPTLF
jgi:hypothetical protein